MTQTHIAITEQRDSARAGSELGSGIRTAFGGAAADAIVVFASAQHDYAALLKALVFGAVFFAGCTAGAAIQSIVTLLPAWSGHDGSAVEKRDGPFAARLYAYERRDSRPTTVAVKRRGRDLDRAT